MILLIFLLYILFATTFTISKTIIEYAHPIFIIGIRMTISGFILISFKILQHKINLKFIKNYILYIIIIALFHIYLSYNLEFIALQYLTSSNVALMYSISPFITAILSYFIFNEKLSYMQYIGLFIGFLGLSINVYIPNITNNNTNLHITLSKYNIILFLSIISSIIGWMLIKNIIQHKQSSPIIINGVAMLIGGILSLITYFYYNLSKPLTYNYNININTFIIHLILLIIIANIICLNLYSFLLKKTSATFLSLAGYTCPLFTAIFSYIWLNEYISQYFILSFIIIIIGVYIFNKN